MSGHRCWSSPSTWRWSVRASATGVDFAVTYIGEVVGNVSGGYRTGAIYEGLLRAEVDLDPAKLGLWASGQFHVSMLWPHGESPSAHGV